MEYTKGEWTIQGMPHQHNFRHGSSYVIRDYRNCALAEVGHIDAIHDGIESEANAHLIAAAPDMYEALHIIIQRASGTGNNMQLKRIIAIAQQAISKAEGK